MWNKELHCKKVNFDIVPPKLKEHQLQNKKKTGIVEVSVLYSYFEKGCPAKS